MPVLRRNSPRLDTLVEALADTVTDEYYCLWNNFAHFPFDPSPNGYLGAYARALRERKQIICVETPLMGRHLFDSEDSRSYYRVAFDFVSTFDAYNFRVENLNPSPDRLHQLLEVAGTSLKPWRTSGSHILYAMQVPADTSLRGVDVFAAAQYDLLQLRMLTNRPIYVTLHPNIFKENWAAVKFEANKQNYEGFLEVIAEVGAVLDTVSGSKALLNDCWCVVCHTSGFGFDAIAEGIPVISLNSGSFVRPISSTSLNSVDNPWCGDVLPHLSKLAYCQWNFDEIQCGDVARHLGVLK